MIGKISLLALAVCAPLAASPARGVELTIFATGSMADPLKEVGEDFTQSTAHTLRFSLGTTGGVLNKLKAGEKGDVIVISDEAAVALEKDGKIAPGSRKDVARALFAVVVKANAPTPEISTPEALKKAVLAAHSISYPDPITVTASGGYIQSVFQLLGIKDEANKKAALKPMGALVGEAVAKGEAELGLSFASEFVADKTLKVVMFPDALQKPQLYEAGVFAGTSNADAARAFLVFITSPAARAKLKAAGVDPAIAGH